MNQDIADRLEILEEQRAEARQMRKEARRMHKKRRGRTVICIHQLYEPLYLGVL